MLLTLMVLNVVLALVLVVLMWRSDLFRSSWPAHVASLAGVVVLGGLLAWVSYHAEAGQAIRLGHVSRMLLVWFLYLPFLIFLAVTYVRAVLRTLENEDGVDAAASRAEVYLAGGDYHRAVRACRGELAADPENVEVRLKLAEALCELGDCEEAVQAYHVAIPQLEEDHERQIQVVFRTAEVLADMLGEYKEAARELDYIRKRFGDTPHAQVAQKRIVRYMTEAD